MYCLTALCLVSNTYRLMHRSANIKNYFEDIFWLQAVAALDPPDIDHQCSASAKHSRTNFTSVPEEAYCLSIPGSFRGGGDTGSVLTGVTAASLPSPDLEPPHTGQCHKRGVVASRVRLVTRACVSRYPPPEWHCVCTSTDRAPGSG